MTTIFAPGVAQTVVKGLVGGNPWANILHWSYPSSTSPWSAANLQTLVNTMMTNWKSQILGLMSANSSISLIQAVDLTNATPATAVTTVSGGPGTASGNANTPAACYLINLNIAARYRGGHPRIYIAGLNPGMAPDGENITTSAQGVLATAFAAMINAVVAALPGSGSGAVTNCVPRYSYTYIDDPGHHKYKAQKSAYLASYVVQSYSVHPKVATQRRRLQTA